MNAVDGGGVGETRDGDIGGDGGVGTTARGGTFDVVTSGARGSVPTQGDLIVTGRGGEAGRGCGRSDCTFHDAEVVSDHAG